MYRNRVDNTITYTPDDVVLFRESPFAAWMERLTLENPDHGIPPDLNSVPPRDRPEPQDDIVATLRAEGRNVALVDWDQDEPDRRAATLEAMRAGADFIVHGQLTVDALAGTASLLMRTSGYSELGDFLYIPCETHSRNTLHSAFRLCFLAHLLQQVQGQMPPQLLIIREGAEVVPLQTEEYIHYFRAVLRRFTQAMATFRKHRMPDPAESSHFGRWTECATEVLKQRAHSEQRRSEELTSEPEQEAEIEVPRLKVANGAEPLQREGSEAARTARASSLHAGAAAPEANSALAQNGAGHTLAEQARMLAPGSYRASTPTGHTPNLARFGRPRADAEGQGVRPATHNRRSSDAALENLEFIGSSPNRMVVDIDTPARRADDPRPAPAPSLRDAALRDAPRQEVARRNGSAGLPELEPRAPVFLPPDVGLDQAFSPGVDRVPEPPAERLRLQPRVGSDAPRGARSVIDLDSAPSPTLAPVVQRAEAEFERLIREDPIFRTIDRNKPRTLPEDEPAPATPFSNSLMTSEDFSDN